MLMKSLKMDEAIVMVGYAICDARKIYNDELSEEFTEYDAKQSVKKLLRHLTGQEPSEENVDEVVDY